MTADRKLCLADKVVMVRMADPLADGSGAGVCAIRGYGFVLTPIRRNRQRG